MNLNRSYGGLLLLLQVCCFGFSAHSFSHCVNRLRCRLIHLYGQAPTAGIRTVKVALTREQNRNTELIQSLHNVQCFEIPCISFETLSDCTATVVEGINSHDVVAITSPQSAKVFLSIWKAIGEPSVKVACVGKGTARPLVAAGLLSVFEPSDATALSFGKELPPSVGSTIFYPTSALADSRLEELLMSRGFKVTRVNSYTTRPAQLSPEQVELGREMDIVMFASPSAVKCWAAQVGTAAHAVAIGSTTANAARKAGFERVSSPSAGSKGVGPWAELAMEIAAGLQR